MAGYTPGYGYRYNAARDGLEVDAEQMRTVRRIFEMVAQSESFYFVIRTLEREGICSPRGQERWNRSTIRNLILNDLYRPHTAAEVEVLVASEVATTLAPGRCFGIAYYGKKQITKRQVSEGSGEKRRYRRRIKAKTRDRTQWLAVPVPDSGLPRELVDTARQAIKHNRQSSSSGHKIWEVSGGLIRCAECGYSMATKIAGGGKAGKRLFYYRCAGRYKGQGSMVICSHKKHHRTETTEAKVWRLVRSLFEDPEQLRADLERMIELERGAVRGEPEREAKTWLDKVGEVEQQRSRAQDMAIRGLLDYNELRAKLASLEETRKTAGRELAVLQSHQERLAELERDKETVLEHYATITPEALDSLSSEERRQLYKMLRLKPYSTLTAVWRPK